MCVQSAEHSVHAKGAIPSHASSLSTRRVIRCCCAPSTRRALEEPFSLVSKIIEWDQNNLNTFFCDLFFHFSARPYFIPHDARAGR